MRRQFYGEPTICLRSWAEPGFDDGFKKKKKKELSVKKYLVILSLFSIGVVAANANLTTFDYSYTFSSGVVASGTLEGVLNGQTVTDVQDVTLTLNQTAVGAGVIPVVITSVTSADGTSSAVVSYIDDDNNFYFGNASAMFVMLQTGGTDPNPPIFVGTGPYASSYANGYEQTEVTDANGLFFGLPDSWSLTEVGSSASPVPEPSTYISGALMMLPLGAGMLRRLRKA